MPKNRIDEQIDDVETPRIYAGVEMAARSEPLIHPAIAPGVLQEGDSRPSALVLKLHRNDARGRAMIDQASGDLLGPGRGLLLGLVLGALLWLCIGGAAWELLRL